MPATYRSCPGCGQEAQGEPYDIGSGPEFACSNCETCWGAEGQNLNPYDPMLSLAKDPDIAKMHDALEGNDPIMLVLRPCPECGKAIGCLFTYANGVESTPENCGQHS